MRKIILPLLFCSVVCHAQTTNIGSLKSAVANPSSDSAKINALRELGYYYWERNPDSSIYYSQQLIDFGEKIHNEWAQAMGYTRMGRAYNNKVNYGMAIKNLLIGLRKFEQVNDSSWVANSYNHLGNVNKNIGRIDLAIYYYKLCLSMAEKIADVNNQMIASMQLGATYADLNNLDSALYFEQKAFQLNRQLENELELDVIFYVLGSVYSKLGEANVAKSYFHRSLEISTRDKDLKPASLAFNGLAKSYLEEGQIDSALLFARHGLAAAKLSSNMRGILQASSILSEVFEAKKQYDSAFSYQKVSISAKDSLSNNEKTRQVEAFNYNEAVRQQEIRSQKEKEKHEREMNLQYAAIAIGLTMGLLIFLALSRKFITSTRTIEIIGVLALLFVFEFINLLIHPFIGNLTHHSPLLMLLIMVGIAGMLVPAHHHLEKRIIHKLVEKNKKIRLAAAKKTISRLEGNTN